MAEYVSLMATRIVMPQQPLVNAAFRKFVSQILTSTRLPSTTILLGMNYLAKRVNMMSAAGLTNFTEGQIWRMVTVSLLLGSKFLDDNTFQNKSWSEVSGIGVQELNTLEYEWLGAIGWCLYVNLDESKDYNAWLANWQDWLDKKKRQQSQATRERLAVLAPIDTDVARPRNSHTYSTWHQQQVAEYERLSSMKRNQPQLHLSPYRREAQQPWMYTTGCTGWHAPLTPPDSGYGTPEYANSATSMNSQYNDWFDRAVTNTSNGHRQFPQSATYHGFQHHSQHTARHHSNLSAYYNYSQNIWEPPSVADCNCANCAAPAHQKNQTTYYTPQAYGQSVVG